MIVLPMTTCKRFGGVLLLGCLVGFPLFSYALSLSSIELKSGLNQVLDARIPIASASTQELENLRISVRHDGDYSSIQRQPKIHAELVANPEGAHFLHIKSEQPIKEPLVNFILELNWSKGRLNRHYELLIDPKLG